MTIKGWMLGKTSGKENRDAHLRTPTVGNAAAGQPDGGGPALGSFGGRTGAADESVHLGPYRALIAAIREELEQFVTHQLRLHLAIAERDRYVLASIEVECEGGEAERELLQRFIREFRPEQVKHYLAKEVIAGLRNASAIDLSQFAGLNAEREAGAGQGDEERYGDLIAELASGASGGAARPYRVTIVGRWSELGAPTASAGAKSARLDVSRTPLAARAVGFDIEDAAGARRAELTMRPGHRYSVGKGEACDIVLDGTYASRRHCELWFESGGWWVADTGSTNGIRVEAASGVLAFDEANAHAVARERALALPPGARLVLAAHMQGDARQYPRLSLAPVEAAVASRPASAPKSATATPVTPIAPPRRRDSAWTITVRMASGTRSVDVDPDALPFRVGRSRKQALVIDWAHAEVSGHHFEIVAIDDAGARVAVHGDNGVVVNGIAYGPGAEFRWKAGETLELAHGSGRPACALTLAAPH
jgi:hypothetical protein